MKRILFNWYYDRQDLTNYLLDLEDELQIVFIRWHAFPPHGEPAYLNGKNVSIIYWGQFKTPYQLLDTVNPEMIVFHDIEAFNQLGLNIAARNRGIPTVVLQHGLRGGYEVEEAVNFKQSAKIAVSQTSSWTLKFLLKSLKFKNLIHLFNLIKFILQRKTLELTLALYKNKFELRRADFYIEFSNENASYHKKRDGVINSRILIIGNPSFDEFHIKMASFASNEIEPYALLIDSPFCEANFLSNKKMSLTEKNNYIKSLNDYSKINKLSLAVKLHPLTYNADYLYKDENIKYFKEHDLTSLVGKASLIFMVHFSTITPHIVIYKPFIYFKNDYVSSNAFFDSLKISVLDLCDISSDNLITNAPVSPPLKLENVEEYIFKPDGKAKTRLREILISGFKNDQK